MIFKFGMRGRFAPAMDGRANRLVALVAALACVVLAVPALGGSEAFQSGKPAAARPADAPPPAGAPSEEELSNATYQGIGDSPVTLEDGTWRGEPFEPGGVSLLTVELERDFRLVGDLDGDGSEEAVVLLYENAGGSGTYVYVAVVGRRAGDLVNLGTALLGDRVELRGGRISERRLELHVVQSGPADAACCPTQKATRVWTVAADGLQGGSSEIDGTISVADLGGVEWVLTHFGRYLPAPPEPAITLVFEGERVSGSSGCNRYFAEVKAGKEPAELEIGAVGATRMACSEDLMALEGRYLETLQRVIRFGFATGRLALTWLENGRTQDMLFAPGQPGASRRP
jgi:heat shock protein HslJ